jgi:hypothetical protein
MAQPFNYQLQVQDPFASTLRAVQLGSTLQQAQAQQQKSVLDQQLVKQAIQRQQLFQDKVNDIRTKGLGNASAEDFFELQLLTDEKTAGAIRQGFEAFDKNQQQSILKFGSEVLSALSNDQPEIAIDRLTTRATALRNSGRPEDLQQAQVLESQAEVVKTNPDFARFDLSYRLAALPGGKEYLENILQVQKAPSVVAEAVAKAKKAGVEAKFAEAEIVSRLDLNKAQIENYASQQEIARENLKIAKLEADLKREENALKRQELQQKIDEAKKTRDEKVVQKQSEANNVLATFDNALNSIDGLLSNWGKDKQGNIDIKKANTTVESATGPISSRMPTFLQSTADFEENLASLESQAFLSQVDKMRGLGALTEREGGRLVNALGSLSLRQSPEQLGRNLLEIQRLMLKARAEVERKYGVTLPPDRPQGPGGSEVPPPQVPSAMGQATNAAVRQTMPSGFRVLGRETPR